MIQIAHIHKSFGAQQVLRDVTLDIPAGQIVGLLGPNGAGKSTLMKILIGPWKPDKPLTNDHNPLYEEMYVTEYLQFMAKMTGISKSRDLEVSELIEKVGLTPERHKHIRELSKGYRQRVGLAQALLGDPELLILDEPTTGLDPNQLVEIRSLIRNIAGQKLIANSQQPTIILSTHIMQEVREMCDRVIILDHGQIKTDKMINEIEDLEQLFHNATLS